MNNSRISRFWIFPIAGLILGILYPILYHAGLTTIWYKIGSPAESFVKILGVKDEMLYVKDDQDGLYSYDLKRNSGLTEPSWNREPAQLIETTDNPPSSRWVTLPLFVESKQIYTAEFGYNIEGTGYIKALLAQDGTLWVWKVLRPWGEFICPGPVYWLLGAFAGGLAWLILKGIKEWREKRRLFNSVA